MASREDLIAGAIFTVTGLAIPSAVIAHHFFAVDIMEFADLGLSRYLFGWSFAVMAVAVAALNVYLGYVRPRLHARAHANMKTYSHISGLPGIGGFLVLFAAVLIPASAPVGFLLLVVYLADTGGLPWFFVATVLLRPRE